ncbi:hypothetical protein LNL84_09750 [Vibrio sp. ZSDZ34]|jgi:hypothetical protein|uniref:Lipoprotein n=1 Tax=Vibrio gelatinilyticus TaxID=2893468 RepID=A0A9X2AW83_9VIBR|nr:hypothetical protein [Vibrio gelatinilyticus]MCJ2377110.1 hypothetical protein [Vibrio gelatinilyticus]
MKLQILAMFILGSLMFGCANDKPLGYSVATLKHEQTYDHNATTNNKDVVPTGTGTKMQQAYDVYTGENAYSGENVVGGMSTSF